MMQRIGLVAVTIGVGLACVDAPAQAQSRSCPPALEAGKIDLRVFVVRSDAQAYTDAATNTVDLERPLDFGMNLLVTAIPDDQDRRLLTQSERAGASARRKISDDVPMQVCQEETGETFYMKGRDIVFDGVAMRVLDVPEWFESRPAQTNPAFLKIVIGNNVDRKGEEFTFNTVAVTNGPGAAQDDGTFRELQKTQTLRSLNLYKVSPAANGATTADGTSQEYLLLGRDDRTSQDGKYGRLIGWVPASAVHLWPNQLGIVPNQANRSDRKEADTPLLVYRNLDAASTALFDGEVRDDMLLGGENLAAAVPDFTPDKSRFPVLEQGENTDKAILKIAYVADTLKVGAAEEVCKADRSAQIAVRDDLQRDREQRDILFLIDATSSMGAYFAPIQNAIADYMKYYEGRPERANWRFATAVYRDFKDGAGLYQRTTDFSSDPGAIELALSKVKATSAKGDDTPEALWNAVYTALKPSKTTDEKLSWRPGAASAIVIIGDHPDRQSLSERKDLSRLIEGMRPDQRPSVYAVNVYPKTKKSLEKYNEAFRRQIDQLKQKIGVGGEITVVPSGLSADAARSEVLQALNNFREFTRDVVGGVELLAEDGLNEKAFKKSRQLFGELATKVAAELLREKLAERGIPCARIGEVTDIILDGFVNRFPPGQYEDFDLSKSLYSVEVRIDEGQITKMLGVFLTAIEQMQYGDPSSAGSVIATGVNSITGDRWRPDEDFGNFVRRIFHVPLSDEYSLLRFTADELGEIMRGSHEKNRMIRLFSQVSALLTGVQQGRALYRDARAFTQLLEDPDNPPQYYVPDIVPSGREWFFELSKTRRFAWVPVAYFPWSGAAPAQ